MAIIVFQHSDIGTPGRVGACLRDHGFKLDIRRPDKPVTRSSGGVPADFDDVQGVLILGGAQNVTDIAQYPWMQQEAEFVKKAHEQGLPVVGICLGAQLIAHALGGAVGFRATPELGMANVHLNTMGQIETLLAGVPWTHPQFFACEQEVQKLPPGAVLLGSTKTLPNAIFRVGLRTLGFAPHFECDEPMMRSITAACSNLAAKAGTNQAFVEKQTADLYQSYARVSDRLCVNIASYCFPLERRRSA